MDHGVSRWGAVGDRHIQGVNHKDYVLIAIDRGDNNLSAESVERGAAIGLAFPGGVFGNVGNLRVGWVEGV